METSLWQKLPPSLAMRQRRNRVANHHPREIVQSKTKRWARGLNPYLGRQTPTSGPTKGASQVILKSASQKKPTKALLSISPAPRLLQLRHYHLQKVYFAQGTHTICTREVWGLTHSQSLTWPSKDPTPKRDPARILWSKIKRLLFWRPKGIISRAMKISTRVGTANTPRTTRNGCWINITVMPRAQMFWSRILIITQVGPGFMTRIDWLGLTNLI